MKGVEYKSRNLDRFKKILQAVAKQLGPEHGFAVEHPVFNKMQVIRAWRKLFEGEDRTLLDDVQAEVLVFRDSANDESLARFWPARGRGTSCPRGTSAGSPRISSWRRGLA